MRVNLAKSIGKNIASLFFTHTIKLFAEEYNFPSLKVASVYVVTGKQGLTAYIEFLVAQGYSAKMYFLQPNKDLFHDVGEEWSEISRTSPSFGFTISDDDPMLVEFKLTHG